MKTLGYIIITVGFLASAIAAVLDEQIVQWSMYSFSLLFMVFGIILLRKNIADSTTAAHVLDQNLETLEASLNNIVTNIRTLNAEKSSLDTYDAHQEIDRLFTEDLSRFVEARKSLAHRYGLQQYADIMGYFAAGERYLNRVWSASTDGYVDEVNKYLELTKIQFEEALEKYQSVKEQFKNPSQSQVRYTNS